MWQPHSTPRQTSLLYVAGEITENWLILKDSPVHMTWHTHTDTQQYTLTNPADNICFQHLLSLSTEPDILFPIVACTFITINLHNPDT